jgi:hypothetical protein
LEGPILPEIGKTKVQFVSRSLTFVTAHRDTPDVLGQIFDIRSKVEHLHNALDVLPGSTSEKEIMLYERARQIDHLARFTISRILENDALREIFRTDASIADFWNKPDAERTTLWGTRLKLDAIA